MKVNQKETVRHKKTTNWPFLQIRFLLLFLLPSLVWTPSQAKSPSPLRSTAIHGAIIFDLFQNHNSDGDFTHYAIDSGESYMSTVNENWFSLSGSLAESHSMKTTFEASFDFMGENGFEIVTAWIRLEKKNWCLLVGKAESLVATGETTLNYDGFYSSGGIQTGAKANQNQIQFGYKCSRQFTLAISLTDEPAQNGSPAGQPFSSQRPAIEGALFFDFTGVSGKLAVHSGDMRVNSGEHFHPGVVMAELNVPLSGSFSCLISGFRTKAGSQFFSIDILHDFTFTTSNHAHSFSASGGLMELLFQKTNWKIWAGVGTLSLNGASVEYLRIDEPDHALIKNRRLSIGSIYHFSNCLHAGLEVSRFRTSHLKDRDIAVVHATSIQLQLALTF